MTCSTEGLPGDPALGVLLLILLCKNKKNGTWDPDPAATSQSRGHAKGWGLSPLAVPSLAGHLCSGQAAQKVRKGDPEEGLGELKKHKDPSSWPRSSWGTVRGCGGSHWETAPLGTASNSVRPHPAIVELINAGGCGLAESRAAQADLMRLQAGGWLSC